MPPHRYEGEASFLWTSVEGLGGCSRLRSLQVRPGDAARPSRWEDFLAGLQCPHQWGDTPLSPLPTRTFFVGCHVTLVIKAGSRGHRCPALSPSSPLTVAARWWIHTISWYIWTWGDVRKPRPIPSKLGLVKGAGFPFLLGWPTVRIFQYPRVRAVLLIFQVYIPLKSHAPEMLWQ